MTVLMWKGEIQFPYRKDILELRIFQRGDGYFYNLIKIKENFDYGPTPISYEAIPDFFNRLKRGEIRYYG